VSLFWLSTPEEHCDFRNNIVYSTTAGKLTALSGEKGSIALSHNFLPTTWQAQTSDSRRKIVDDGTSPSGKDPRFASLTTQDFRLLSTSPCLNAGVELAEACRGKQTPTEQYVKHRGGESRQSNHKLTIGAFSEQR
jgi:hypothetical protein